MRRWPGQKLAAGLWLAAILTVLAFPSRAAADLGGFTIEEFHTRLTVEPNAELLVTERITVDFQAERHGIYRTIPVRYTDPRGFDYSIGFRLIEVTDDAGSPYQTKVSRQGRYVKIRIGDPERLVSGRQVYVIRYRVEGAVSHFSDHDEIYWNAVGDEWLTSIKRASATVSLPGEIPADSLETAAYAGMAGSRDQIVDVDVPSPSLVSFVGQRSLGPREALTVAVAWPHGYVTFPGWLSRLWRLLMDNIILAAPLVAVAGLYWRYRTAGRDPEGPGAVTVRYEPPEGVSPAQLGTIVDEKVDLRDITAVVVDLAVRGYLRIGVEEHKGLLRTRQETTFERLKRSTSQLRPHEQAVLGALFEAGDRVTTADLKYKFYKRLPGIRDRLYRSLVEQGYFTADPASVKMRYVIYGVLAGLLVFPLGLGWALVRGSVMPYALVSPTVADILTVLSFVAFAPAMPRRTREGVRLRNWALGFEEFIDRVEADRLERDQARGVFERLLPYAMALGLAAAWARKFEGIYETAGPGWYVGPFGPGGFSTVSFEDSLSASMSAVAGSMAASPRSSGSSGVGGGGFSGGGFGGGGGGSW